MIGCQENTRFLRAGSLLEAEEGFNAFHVHAGNEAEVGEVAFLLLGLLGEDVALEGVFSLNLSCSGKGEPLFGTGISLNLRHFELSYLVNCI